MNETRNAEARPLAAPHTLDISRLKNLLVYAPSETRSAAARIATLAATVNGSNVTLADSIENLEHDVSRKLPGDWDVPRLVRDRKTTTLQRIATRMRRLGLHPRVSIGRGSAPEAVRREVEESGCDLLILDADHNQRGPNARALVQSLIEECPCPVLFARPVKRRRRMHILTAIDSSVLSENLPDPLSMELMHSAVSFAALLGGEVHVLHAWQSASDGYMRWAGVRGETLDEHQEFALAEAREHVTRTFEPFRELVVALEIHLEAGDPQTVIPQFAERHRIDLVVIGTAERKGISRHIIGNTADAVFDGLGCSMMVVPRPSFSQSDFLAASSSEEARYAP
jgi:universal stress protein E